MATAQLNARLDANLKREGDSTLARFGISTSDAIRALWTTLANTGTLPSFMRHEAPAHEETSPLAASETPAAAGAGMALRMAREQGLAAPSADMDYQTLRDLAFEEMITEGRYRAQNHA